MRRLSVLSPIAHAELAAPPETRSAITSGSSFPTAILCPPSTTLWSAAAADSSTPIRPPRRRDYDRFYCEWSKYDDSATATGSGVSPYDAARLATTASDIARALPSRAASHPRCRMRHRRPAHGASRPGIHSSRRTGSFAALRRRVPRAWL